LLHAVLADTMNSLPCTPLPNPGDRSDNAPARKLNCTASVLCSAEAETKTRRAAMRFGSFSFAACIGGGRTQIRRLPFARLHARLNLGR
jgi:hypothetical protein